MRTATRVRLAWRRLRRWLRPPRRFPPTREGWWFLVSTLLVGGAAINSGFNLLFLVWGMMIFLILASGVLSELCLQRLVVNRQPPATIHAGSPFLMGIAVRNAKRKVPSFALEVEDLVGERPLDRRVFFIKLPAGKEQQTAYRKTVAQRGLLRLSGYRLSTKFPFGLIRKSRDIEAPLDLVVYPALVPVPPDLLAGAPVERGRASATKRSRRGEFFGLREFRHGDDPRDIHWRTSARRGRATVRESEDESGITALILFDNALPPDVSEAAFESAVSMAASVAVMLLGRGYRVGIVTRSGDGVPVGDGKPQIPPILRMLALLGRAPADAAIVDPGGEGIRIRIRPGIARPIVEVSARAGSRGAA